MQFLKKAFQRLQNRHLQVHILTLFLSLLIASSIAIISFFYVKTANSILEFSKGTIERVSEAIREKINCLITDLLRTQTLVSSLISTSEDISLENKQFTTFILKAIKTYPQLHAFLAATPDGRLIEASDVTHIRDTYLSDPSKKLPHGVSYALREIKPLNGQSSENWYYMDENFKILTQENIKSSFHTTQRPWYIGAKKAGTLYWTKIYKYHPTLERGITASTPIFNDKKELIAVTGVDLPIAAIENFFSSQKIGKTGTSYLLDEKGKIIIPEDADSQDEAMVASLQKTYLQNKEENYLMDYNETTYLVNAQHFPIAEEQGWVVYLVAPLNDFFGEIFKARRQTIIISFGILLLSSLLVYYFSKRVSRPIVQLTTEIGKIQNLDLHSEKRVTSHIYEISLLDSSIAAMRIALRSFGRYVPKEIVRKLLEKGEIAVGGEKKEVTVFFSDIANFTPIAESTPIDVLMPSLSNYFDRLSRIILASQGTIDKFIGDSIMAFWGAPNEVEFPVTKACSAALCCQAELTSFNLEQQKLDKPPFYTRIGIHTGEVIVGNIGTAERLNYTAMGDVVNEAARLQQVNKNYHTNIIISEEVCKKLDNQFLIRPLDIVTVKGKKEKIKIYELLAQYGAEENISPKSHQIELCRLFTQAYHAFVQEKKEESKSLFLEIQEKFPNDFPTQLYLERIARP